MVTNWSWKCERVVFDAQVIVLGWGRWLSAFGRWTAFQCWLASQVWSRTQLHSVGFSQSRIRVKHFFTNSLGCSRRCRPPSVWPSQGDVYKLYLHKRGRGSNKGIFCTLLGLHVYDKQGGWNKKIRKYANVFLGFHASTFSVSVKFWKLLARFW